MMKKLLLRLVTVLFVLLSSTANIFSQDVVPIIKNEGDINFDGVPDELFWQNAHEFQLVEYSPNYNTEPTENSTVYFTYDNDYLWVGAFLEYDNAAEIVSTSKKRDEESKNPDSFGILLDTYNDNENALAFFTMPAGQRIDYAVSNDAQRAGGGRFGGDINYSWNTFWEVKTARTENGWSVEMRIPFSSLRFQEVDGKIIMGLLINRTISHINETDTYPATNPKYGSLAANKPSLAKKIELQGVKNSKPVYVAPYITAGIDQLNTLNIAETGFDFNNDKKLTGGLDIKYSLTSNLTMDVTVNTDFAQVEADDERVNLTRFALFYPEKRMFFQERSSIFDFDLGGPSKLFYSRRIGIGNDGSQVPILGGARLNGRIGKWDMGFMDMQTGEKGINPSENFGVLRFRRQVFNPNSYIGAILTSRIVNEETNTYSFGLDGIFRIFGNDYVQVNLAQTTDEEGNNNIDDLKDNKFYSISWERRNQKGFAYNLSYNYTGNEFYPSVGFLSRNGTMGPNIRLQYGWLPGADSRLFSYSLDFMAFTTYRVSDKQIESGRYGPGFSIRTKKGWSVKLDVNYQIEGVDFDFNLDDNVVVPANRYEYITFRTSFRSPSSKLFSNDLSVSGGQFYDGNNFTITTEPVFNVSSSVQLTGYYNFNHVVFPNRIQEMNAHVVRFKFLYMLNTKLSFSSFIQYNSINNFTVSNFRLRYNPREGNDLYIVYNEISPTTGYFNPQSEKVSFLNRTFQIKYVYTFRL